MATPSDNKEWDEKSSQQIPISGRFDQYRSSYWAASVAVLPLRYLLRPFIRHDWDKVELGNLAKNKYSATAGGFMLGVTGYYAQRTYEDMRAVFSEALSWEFDKKPQDVNYADFNNSKNTIIEQTVANFKTYNGRRFLVNSTFFLPLLAPVLRKFGFAPKIHPETGVDLGVAANAAYLFSDVLTRRITPFEELQSIIDHKINHAEDINSKITAGELLNVYERNAAKTKLSSFLSQRGTPEWDRSMELFERMADLMNQNYGNSTKTEETKFGFPHFIYLVGHDLINPHDVDRSHFYIELAAHKGIPEVKQAAARMAKGATLEELEKQYETAPISLPPMPEKEPKKPLKLAPASFVEQIRETAANAVSSPDSLRAAP